MEKAIKTPKVLNFNPLIDIGFWSTLAKKKLEEYKLDTSPKPVFGKYKITNFKDKISQFYLDLFSFQMEKLIDEVPSGLAEIKIIGKILNCNTIEEFYEIEKDSQIKKLQEEFEEKLEKNDSFLGEFTLMTFADLKNHKFSYKFFFPLKNIENLNTISIDALTNTQINQIKLEEFLRKILFDKKNALKSIFFCEFESSFIEISKENYLDKSEKGLENVFIVFIDAFNQQEGVNGIVFNGIAGLLKKGKNIKNLQIVVLKDSLIYNEEKCISFKNSLLWKLDVVGGKENGFILQQNNTKVVDLKQFLDEKTLATNAVDLNLKLMKWRLLPSLDLEKIKQTKCLLIGAGTLGCQLSRNLMAWGFTNIDFIDNGKVSYSNPVRQSLYTFEDSVKAKPKAVAAAENLQLIYPGMNTKGHNMDVPKPGHFASNPEQVKQILETCDHLEKLICTSDVVFLLTDTRESRWLPTVLAQKHNKICITVGLGFESFVVVRHGIPLQEDRLGCYFCNDILSPSNSTADRTLDQQCTVTRPGLSYISSALASELLVTLLHHPLGGAAPAYEPDKGNLNEEIELGIIPQHIRGNLSDFDFRMLVGKAFTNCVACSEFVVKEFVENRDEFLIKVTNTPDYLQDVAKITEALENVNLEEAVIELDDDF